ncbi:MAG: hypothetical protein ABIH41_01515 [Nanoarchaeota archaeon]
MHIDDRRLRQKGWSSQEIEQAASIVARKRVDAKDIVLAQASFWTLLLLSSLATIVFAFLIMSLVLFFPALFSYYVLVVLGASFGVLFSMSVKDIETYGRYHHIAFMLLNAVVAVVSFVLVLGQAAGIPSVVASRTDPVLAAVLYALAFVGPYAYFVKKRLV